MLYNNRMVYIIIWDAWIFFGVCFVLQYCDGQINVKEFKKFIGVSNIVCSGNSKITQINSVSLCQCSDNCLSNARCLSFFYNSNLPGTCTLHDTVVTDFTLCIEEMGTFFYIPKDYVPATTENIPTTTQTLQLSCNVGWQMIGTGCYQFTPGGMAYWLVAKDSCESLGGYLAAIESLEENNALKAASGTEGGDHFIGGNDLTLEGTFVWDHLGTQITGFQDWYPNQPDNGDGVQHCIMLQSSYNYVWNDAKCNVNRKYICEQDPVNV